MNHSRTRNGMTGIATAMVRTSTPVAVKMQVVPEIRVTRNTINVPAPVHRYVITFCPNLPDKDYPLYNTGAVFGFMDFRANVQEGCFPEGTKVLYERDQSEYEIRERKLIRIITT